MLLPSRAGPPVPAVRAGGRDAPFHSLVDPQREGLRLSAGYPGEGCCLALGLGAGYHLAALAARPDISRLWIVERDLPLLRAVAEGVDLRPLLGDPRTRLLVDPDPLELSRSLLEGWLPALEGRLHVVPLRPAFALDPEGYGRLQEAAQALAGRAADDYTVQSRFGGRWFVNTLRNLELAQEGDPPLPRFRRALVTGAGPSLEGQLGALRALRAGAALFATDTSLPALLAHGLEPDVVVSIDCQATSLLHFGRGLPPRTVLALDLASPPSLARLGVRLGGRLLFTASAHPLSRYLDGAWRRFLAIDTSGGNVSHAAVSLADRLGAAEIHLFGMDFSCPDGKSYARGTYLYPFFEGTAGRLRPLEEAFYSFLLRSPALERERGAQGWRYRTPQLTGYRERLERLLAEVRAAVFPVAGEGLAIRVPAHGRRRAPGPAGRGPRRRRTRRPGPAGRLATGAPSCAATGPAWSHCRRRPRPSDPGWRRCPLREKALWLTLLPTAAFFRERPSPGGGRSGGPGVLEEVRRWALARVAEALAPAGRRGPYGAG